MDDYENHLAKCLLFIDENQLLIDCHLVDFITENLWEKCLTQRLRFQLEQLNETNCNIIDSFHDNINDELNEFIDKTKVLNLKNCKSVLRLDEISTLLPNVNFDWDDAEDSSNRSHNNFMKNKKQYEINVLTKVIGYLSKANSNLVIDVGAGKGYLATSLSQKYGIPVLAIDSSESRYNSAIHRQELMKKKKHQSFPSVSLIFFK